MAGSAAPAEDALSGAAAGPILKAPGPWRRALAGLISLALATAILVQLRGGTAETLALLARLPAAAWALFGAAYLAQPIADYAIFARLWNLPRGAFAAMLRKTAINEAVFGYGGELYLYLWARNRPGVAAAPFLTVKDVSILSALAGNLLTLAMLAYSAPRLHALHVARQLAPALWGAAGVAALSLCLLVFARRVFSLPGASLAMVAGVQALRVVVVSGLNLMLWRLALPAVPLETWAHLLTLRLLVSRAPFITSKELVFGNLVLLLAGPREPAALLLASLALAWLGAHLAVLLTLGMRDGWRARGRRPA